MNATRKIQRQMKRDLQKRGWYSHPMVAKRIQKIKAKGIKTETKEITC